jgi:hypothetical protein
VPAVRHDIEATFRRLRLEAIVCSAACGADLLALDTAQVLDIEAHVVLPFDSDRFRATSVVDRPGDWGRLYDAAIAKARASDRLTVLPGPFATDSDAFSAATHELVRRARELSGADAVAIAIWDARPRDADDFTAEFVRAAGAEGMQPISISTLRAGEASAGQTP